MNSQGEIIFPVNRTLQGPSRRVRVSSLHFMFGYLCILLLAALGYLFPVLYYVAVFAAVPLSLFFLRSMILRWSSLTPYTVLAVNFAAGYLIGPAVAVVYYLLPHSISPILLSGPFAFDGDTTREAPAVVLASLVVIELIFLGDISSNKFLRVLRNPLIGNSKRDYLLVIGLVAVVAAAFRLGDLGYMGAQNIGDSNRITVLGGLAFTILPSLPVVFLAFAVDVHTKRLFRGASFVLALLAFAAVSVSGRRFLLFSLLSAFVVAVVVRPQLESFLSLRWLRKARVGIVIGALLIGFTLLLGLRFFYYLRISTETLGATAAFSSRLVSAGQIMRSGTDHHFLGQSATRSGTLPGYLGALLESRGDELNGACMVDGAVIAIPRSLLSGKAALINESPCVKERVNAVHGLAQIDSPVTIIVQGYDDFKFFGPFLYVVVIGLLFTVVVPLCRLARSRCFSVFAAAVCLNTLLFVENDLSFYFVALRNLIIVFLAVFFLRVILPGKGSVHG